MSWSSTEPGTLDCETFLETERLQMKQQIYAVTLYGGYVVLIKASSIEQANKLARQDQGSANVQHVALAKPEDIDWVRAMGAPVPELDPVLPSEWARKGFYVVEGRAPKPGSQCDYYDRDGNKRYGTIKSFDGQNIVIDGERVVIVEETFKVRYGR